MIGMNDLFRSCLVLSYIVAERAARIDASIRDIDQPHAEKIGASFQPVGTDQPSAGSMASSETVEVCSMGISSSEIVDRVVKKKGLSLRPSEHPRIQRVTSRSESFLYY